MINLELSIEEANLILTALGQRPYIEVHDLVNNIRQQAAQQMRQAQNDPQLHEQPNPNLSPQPEPQ